MVIWYRNGTITPFLGPDPIFGMVLTHVVGFGFLVAWLISDLVCLAHCEVTTACTLSFCMYLAEYKHAYTGCQKSRGMKRGGA